MIAAVVLALVLGLLWGFRTGNSRFDIMGRPGTLEEGRVYLRRWWLLGESGSGSTGPASRLPFALMLHQFLRPDADTCPHDHPWAFFTLVLWGGYDESYRPDLGLTGEVEQRNRPGILLYRPAHFTHRVTRLLNGRDCWTLVLRLKKERTWGFHTPHGWIKWTDVKHLILWCRERVEGRP